MKKVFMILILVVMMTGCYEMSSDMKQSLATEDLMNEINNQIGLPDIQNFTEKKIFKDIYELRDDAELITHAYTRNLNGKLVYVGTCIGFGLPYSTQFTNPKRYQGVVTKEVVRDGGKDWTYAYKMVDQAEPNGLFTASGMSATWLILINPDTGKREIIYSEPELEVYQSKRPVRLCAEWSLPTGYVDGFVAIDER